MKKLIHLSFTLLLFFAFHSLSAQSIIRGNITNQNQESLEFASIYVKETGQGAIANAEGFYELRMSPGKYTLIFQYLGYESFIKELNAAVGLKELNVSLKPQAVRLAEVEVKSNAEDPAYTVMRKAIAKADYHRNQLNKYESTVYIKGSGRLKKTPGLFRKQIEKEGIDSTTAFATESVSKIKYERPNKYTEKVISIYTRGDNQNTSPNSYFKGSFYDDNNGTSISPLSKKAFGYYKFKLEGYFHDRGYNVNKIKVTPRSRGEDVYEGYIYILEDYWSIHSLALTSHNFGFTNSIEQIYAPIQQNVWMPVSFRFKIAGKILGFGFEYLYLATASDYKIEINPDLNVNFAVIDEKLNKELAKEIESRKGKKNASIHEKLDLGKELTRKDLRKLMREYEKQEQKAQEEPEIVSERHYKIDSLAYKKDSTYWATVRPIPLTKYEVKGYARSDSLATVEKEEEEGKSSDKFSFGDVVTGYRFKTGAHSSFAYSSPLMGIRFNPVEGFSVHEKFTFRKRGDEKQHFEASITPRYAFARKKMTGIAKFSYSTGESKNETNGTSITIGGSSDSEDYFKPETALSFGLEGGRYIFQYNESKPIDEYLSMIENLFRERNYIRLYEKDYLKYTVTWKSEKWSFKPSVEWAKRYTLQNNTHQTWLNKDDQKYANNIPQNEETLLPLSGAETAFVFSGVIEGRPWQKYKRYNGKKRAIANSSPLLRFEFRNAFRSETLGADADFTQYDFTISHNFKLGVRSNIRFKLNAGFFTNTKKMAFTDFKHFTGNKLVYTTADPLGSFRLLDYYRHSTNDKYLAASAHYGFRKFVFTQIPAVWMLGMRENLFVNYLSTPTSQNYVELGYSLDKIFRFFRVEAVASFQDGKYKDFGVLIGISTDIGSMVNVE